MSVKRKKKLASYTDPGDTCIDELRLEEIVQSRGRSRNKTRKSRSARRCCGPSPSRDQHRLRFLIRRKGTIAARAGGKVDSSLTFTMRSLQRSTCAERHQRIFTASQDLFAVCSSPLLISRGSCTDQVHEADLRPEWRSHTEIKTTTSHTELCNPPPSVNGMKAGREHVGHSTGPLAACDQESGSLRTVAIVSSSALSR